MPANRLRRMATRLVRVCFVCTGNICRSPMADVVLRTMAAGHHAGRRDRPGRPPGRCRSAGTGGWHAGEPMDPRARAALERRGYVDHGHRAQKFDDGVVRRPPISWCAWTGATSRPC